MDFAHRLPDEMLEESKALLPWSGTATTLAGPGAALEEAWVGSAAPESGKLGKFVRNVVVVAALRVLGGDPETAVALIEISAASYVFVVGGEASVVSATGPA